MTTRDPAGRRLTSRTVVLTAALPALAAGGTAACDAPSDTTGWTDGPEGAQAVVEDTGYVEDLPRGGDTFASGDRDARRVFKLPATGKVANGTIKTNVVGRSSGGSVAAGDSAGG